MGWGVGGEGKEATGAPKGDGDEGEKGEMAYWSVEKVVDGGGD